MSIIHFAHISDVHLRMQQYGLDQRGLDFCNAWLWAIDKIIELKVDFVTFSGDLFDRAEPGAIVVSQAIEGLRRLKNAGIPVVAIEGNHEVGSYNHNLGWMHFLYDEDLLTLVDSLGDSASPLPRACGPIDGVLVHGIPWTGAATNAAIVEFGRRNPIVSGHYNVLMLHAGLAGILPHDGADAFNQSDARTLLYQRGTDILLLGHVHKPYEVDDWIYNPGSTEACNTTESAWRERGILLFEIDTDAHKHSVERIPVPNRPYSNFTIEVTGKDREMVHQEFRKLVKEGRYAPGNILTIKLIGVSDLYFLASEFVEMLASDPFHVIFRNNVASPGVDSGSVGISRVDIEREVIGELFDDVDVALRVKELALSGADNERILEAIS